MGIIGNMSWVDQIKDASYTAPSGKVFSFGYRDVSKNVALKTVKFTFPQLDGALIMPLGRGGRVFPMVCYFSGEDCFTLADAFEAGLEETGYGELQHPVYGIRKVVPTGEISRNDSLVSEANQVVINVTFAETIIDETFPTSSVVKEDVIDADMDAFADAACQEFEADLVTDNVSDVIQEQSLLKSQFRSVMDGLEGLAKKSASTWTRFQEIAGGVQDGIANVVNGTIEVAQKAISIIRLPSRLAVDVLAKVEGYSSVINSMIKDFTKDPVGANNVRNQFVSTRLMVQTLVASCTSGVALAMSGNGQVDSPSDSSSGSSGSAGVTYVNNRSNNALFKSRTEAIETAVALAQLYDQVVAFCDSKIAKDLFVDKGSGYAAMRDVVVESLDMIVNYSFSLPHRKEIVLGRDCQLLELVVELYGDYERLDEFIVDNNLTYDELQVIQRGRKVAYYV